MKTFVKICQRNYHNWFKPVGYDTNIQIYNCVAKEKVPFIARNKNYITWYTCGPTVYDSAHVGHASCYMKLDIIQRILNRYYNMNLITVMNITDIDDKIIKRSSELKQSAIQLSRQYEKEFLKDLQSLGIKSPDMIIRVTDKIDLVIKFIEKLLKNGNAYRSADGSVYFDTSKLNKYGKLQNISRENDYDGGEFKKSKMDFALWKAAKVNEPFWETNWGPGRPGWHVECSSLAGFLLGDEIDVHAGGIDLQFPHHENEEAQSCAYFSKEQWVNYWIHTGHLHLKNSEKMSKSLKNTVTIPEMLKLCTPEDFRMACLLSHYSKNMEFSSELINTARNVTEHYKNFINNSSAYVNDYLKVDLNIDLIKYNLGKVSDEIRDALSDDFDTASALKSLHNLTNVINKMLSTSRGSTESNVGGKAEMLASVNYVNNIMSVFGIDFTPITKEVHQEVNFEELLNILVKFRQNVRETSLEKKDFEYLKFCDQVRNNLVELGVNVKDYGKKSTFFK